MPFDSSPMMGKVPETSHPLSVYRLPDAFLYSCRCVCSANACHQRGTRGSHETPGRGRTITPPGSRRPVIPEDTSTTFQRPIPTHRRHRTHTTTLQLRLRLRPFTTTTTTRPTPHRTRPLRDPSTTLPRRRRRHPTISTPPLLFECRPFTLLAADDCAILCRTQQRRLWASLRGGLCEWWLRRTCLWSAVSAVPSSPGLSGLSANLRSGKDLSCAVVCVPISYSRSVSLVHCNSTPRSLRHQVLVYNAVGSHENVQQVLREIYLHWKLLVLRNEWDMFSRSGRS